MKLATITGLTVTVSLALGAAAGSRADACSQDAFGGLSGFEVLPAEGTTAPANTRVWISSARWGYDAPPAAAITLERAGVGIPVTVEEIAVAGEVTTTLFVLAPQAPLAPGDAVEVFGVIDAQKVRLSRFLVTAGSDSTPPALPALASIDVASGYFGGFSCGNPSTIAVEVASSGELLVMTRPDEAVGALPSRALAVSATARMTAADLGAGEQTVVYVAVDVAGNVSERSAPISVTVPPEVSGCDASAGGAGWGLVVAGAAALRRRRRPRSP